MCVIEILTWLVIDLPKIEFKCSNDFRIDEINLSIEDSQLKCLVKYLTREVVKIEEKQLQ